VISPSVFTRPLRSIAIDRGPGTGVVTCSTPKTRGRSKPIAFIG
jgi:hypothetical protein